jgi:hypothetical protein
MRTQLLVFALVVLMVLPLQTGLAAAQGESSNPLELSINDLGYGDITLSGMYGTASIYVPYQSNWLMNTGAQVSLDYAASPLLIESRSSLTVFANGVEVASLRPAAPGDGAFYETVSFEVPMAQIQGAGLTLRFQGYFRLTDDPCEETNNPAQWLKIAGTSFVRFGGTEDAQHPSLDALPQAVIVQDAWADPVPVVFVLPDASDDAVLTAAARTAARLGQGDRSAAPPFDVVRAADLTDDLRQSANLVVIGTPENQPLLDALDLAGDGVDPAVQIQASPWNPTRTVLSIVTPDADGLDDVAQILWANVPLPVSDSLLASDPPAASLVPGAPWSGDVTTFAQLGDRTRQVTGIGIFDEYYYFRHPPGWVFDHGAQITLNVSGSPALNERESYVSIFANDHFVGSVRTGGDEGFRTSSFDLPVAALNENAYGGRPQDLVLHLVIANLLEQNACDVINPDSVWTRISIDSYFTTPHLHLTLPDLQAFPYPFVSDEESTPTTIVLPLGATPDEIRQGLDLAATLGHFATQPLDVRMVTAPDEASSALAGSHVIGVGTLDRNPFVGEALRDLTTIPDDEVARALDDPARGILREAPSPWSDKHVVLLVYAAGEAELDDAVRALTYAAPPVQQPGSAAVVEPGGEVRIVYRSNRSTPHSRPGEVTREPLVEEPSQWIIITAILVLTAAAVAGVLLVSRWRSGRSGS